jgi:hypothetical protein
MNVISADKYENPNEVVSNEDGTFATMTIVGE